MRLNLFFLALLFFFSFSFCQSGQLSTNAEISVLTVGQGDNLNDAFGHSAFRVKDRNSGLDIVYGYGRYDFNTPNFYLKFVQGKLNYLMGKRKFSDFFELYRYYDRTIQEQKLNLSQDQKQRLYNYLINNYKPENRAYLYEFFYDNCATKIRDVANITSNLTITYPEISEEDKKTFRELIHEEVGHNTWGSFGIDIALGSLIDKKATKEEQMFLPIYIYKHFENAKLNAKPLVKGVNTIYKSRDSNGYSSNFIFSPIVITTLLAFLILFFTYKNHKENTRSKWLDVSIFAVTGIAGVLLLLLWFGTDHTVTGYNYNLLWAFPLNIFVIGQLFAKQIKNWFRSYLKFLVIMLTLMSMHWIIGVQVFALALLPLLVALFIRYIYLIRIYKK
ncbi:DUF4105 domain-containing protein [Winogradskyella sp.]|nr:DUF4105 domain-containing protein [Winogradskyella sp.]MDA8874537.1 DUF4105 domain-containing protein [Winogradskyella sp.]